MANNHWLDTTLPTIMCGIGPLKLGITQATSNHVPWEEYGTYPLNSMGHNIKDGRFVCPMIVGNHHGTSQSEMH